MAHYAEIDSNNVVVSVFVGRDENDLVDGIESWEDYYSRPGYSVKRTSYNTYQGQHVLGGTPFRGNYAGVGFTYNEDLDAFIPPKTFDSWVFNEDIYDWEPPTPAPEGSYIWDEESTSWVEDVLVESSE